jgi:AcrR family transcriptional regulator
MMNKVARGRRPGQPDTRAQVLDAARRRFLAEGYHAVSLRAIAADAGVDVALISYFFGSKRGLFAAVLALPVNPPDVLRAALPGDLATLPERVLRALLETWDDPKRSSQLRVIVATAVQEPDLRRLLTELLEREMIGLLAEHLGGTDATSRAAAFGTQLAGVVFTRYILGLEPIASMRADELVRHLAPGLRAAIRPQRPPHRAPAPNPVAEHQPASTHRRRST